MRNTEIKYFDIAGQKGPILFLGGWTFKPRKIRGSYYIVVHYILNGVLGLKKNIRPELCGYYALYNGRPCLLIFMDQKDMDGDLVGKGNENGKGKSVSK